MRRTQPAFPNPPVPIVVDGIPVHKRNYPFIDSLRVVQHRVALEPAIPGMNHPPPRLPIALCSVIAASGLAAMHAAWNGTGRAVPAPVCYDEGVWQRQAIRHQILDQLLARTPFELPSELVSREEKATISRLVAQLKPSPHTFTNL